MKEFTIRISSFKGVQSFVELATTQPFRILVSSGSQLVNAKSFIGMVNLDYSQPVQVRCDCNEEEMSRFFTLACQLLAN